MIRGKASIKSCISTVAMPDIAPVGITVYGVVRPIRDGNSWPINWPLNRDQAVHPQYELWPEYENLHQFPLWGAMMEYTVWQSVAPTIWFAAELHVRGR